MERVREEFRKSEGVQRGPNRGECGVSTGPGYKKPQRENGLREVVTCCPINRSPRVQPVLAEAAAALSPHSRRQLPAAGYLSVTSPPYLKIYQPTF